MLAVLLLAPLAMSSPAAPVQNGAGPDAAGFTPAVAASPAARTGQVWQAGSTVSKPYETLFASSQKSTEPPIPSPANANPPQRQVICGMVVITGPEVDPKIRISVPRGDVKFAIRRVPPLGCHREE